LRTRQASRQLYLHQIQHGDVAPGRALRDDADAHPGGDHPAHGVEAVGLDAQIQGWCRRMLPPRLLSAMPMTASAGDKEPAASAPLVCNALPSPA
jgi:hypothetical protein